MTEPAGPAPDQTSLDDVVASVQELIEDVERYSDPTIKRAVFELLDWLDALHRDGLERLATGLRGAGYFDKAIDDPIVAHLFAIYGLVDINDPQPLVEEALDEIRPYVHSHGGEISLVAVEGGVVRIHMYGACDQCPSSVVTLTQSFETAIRERWVGLVRIEVENPPEKWQAVTIKTAG